MSATAVLLVLAMLVGPPAAAAQAPVGLGTATSFAVLAGTTVTNTGPSVISGDLGVSPGTAITGFPPGQVINGAQHAADALALQAQNDLTTAYNDAAGRIPPVIVTDNLGGKTLVPGVYQAAEGMALTGTVTLNAQGDPSAVFIFQAGSTLITASSSRVALTGGAQACNVFWQVGSSATLGTFTTFVGSILALTSITVQTRTTVDGRVLARNGQVSLDNNTITRARCAPSLPTVPPTSVPPTSPTSPAPAPTSAVPPGGGVGGPGEGPGDAGPGDAGPGAGGAGDADDAGGVGGAGDAGGAGGVGGPGSGDDVIPGGAPETGAGGAAHSGRGPLVSLGVLALAGVAGATVQAIRRYRRPPARGRTAGRHAAVE